MSRRIWKWPLNIADQQTVKLPAGAELLDVQQQGNGVSLWALCDPDAPTEPRHLAMYGTGHPIPDEPGEYLATFQIREGELVIHVFELDSLFELSSR